MKRTIKQITAMLLVVIMCVSAPTTALAEGTVAQNNAETVSGQSDVTITGTDSVGNMVAKEATAQQEDQQGKKASISGLNFNGNQAEVEFYTTEDAALVVAVYDEQQVQMLGSGKVTVAAGDTTATVTVNATMPKYFVASAYLLQKDTHKPLCDLYTTQLYTKEIQEVKNSTIDDYKEENVLELDSSDRDNNFAVYNDETVVADESSKKNQITANGDGTYTVKKADASFTGLKKGDTFSYKYDDGSVLLVKVASISVKGSTVTIKEDTNTDLTDFFDYLKIETDGSQPGDMVVDESKMDDGVSLVQEMSDAPAATAVQGDGEFEQSVSYNINTKFKKGNKEVNLEGSLNLKFAESLKYYIAIRRQYFSFELKYSFGMSGNISAKLKCVEIDLGKIETTPIPGIKVAFKPALVVEASAKINFNTEFKGKLGGSYDSNIGFSDLSSAPSCKSKIVVEGTLFLGFKASIVPAVINAKICSAEYNTTAGIEIKGMQKIDPTEDIIHDCKSCIEGKINAKLSVDMKLHLLKDILVDKDDNNKDMFNIKVTLVSATIKLSDWYCSVDREEYGWTACPHIYYPVNVSITDKDGMAVKDAVITLWKKTDKNSDIEKQVMMYTKTTRANSVKTGATGKTKIYVSNGIYTIKADKDGDVKTKTLTVHNIATSIKLKLSKSVVQPTPTPTPEVSQDIIKSGVDQNITWKLTKDGTLYLGGKGEMPRWFTVKGYTEVDTTPWVKYKNQIKKGVIESGLTSVSNAFIDCGELTSIEIPNSVITIGIAAFENCSKLTSVEIPNGVTTIPIRAFRGCTKLKNINIPNSVTKISDWAFTGCTELEDISIPNSVEVIGDHVFAGCTNLTNIEIPKKVTTVSDGVFYNCENLVDIKFHNNIKKIESGAFGGCTNLTSIEIPESVGEIGANAFEDCEKLTNINIPKSVTQICSSVFSRCTNLKSIILPEGITTIEYGAFAECTSLEEIKLPKSLTTIGYEAFVGCEKLETIEIPKNVKEIGWTAFADCTSLISIEIPEKVNKIADSLFAGCSSLKSVSLSKNITEIGELAFEDCTSLESMKFPKKLKTVGYNILRGCTSLKTLYFAGDCLFYKDKWYWSELSDKITVYYPSNNSTWNNIEELGDDDYIWVPYDPSTLNAASISEDTINEEVAQNEENSEFTDVPEDNEFADFTDSIDENAGVESEKVTEGSETKRSVEENLGIENPATENLEPEINSEDTEEVEEIEPLVSYENQPVAATGTMANFSGRMPDSYCLFIVVKDKEAEDILNSENLLYIKQKTADSKGNVSFPYQLRENYANPTSCIYGIEAHTHTYGNWKTIQKATIFEAELRQRECSICELTQTKYFGTKLKPMIKLNASSVTLKTGQSTTGLKVIMSNGDSVVSWKSSNTKIVKVSKTGKLVAQKRAGKATVVVKLNSGLSKKIPVTVQKTTVKTTKITGLKNKITLKAGKTTTLKPVLKPFTSQEKITYTSSNKRVVTVNSKGVLKAVNKGTARITVKSGKQKIVITVTVS